MLDRVLCSSRCLCFVCDPMFFMCSFQISVLFVFMRVEISLFNFGIFGSCGLFLFVKFLCVICVWVVVGVCLCCVSCLLVCVSCLLGKICW